MKVFLVVEYYELYQYYVALYDYDFHILHIQSVRSMILNNSS